MAVPPNILIRNRYKISLTTIYKRQYKYRTRAKYYVCYILIYFQTIKAEHAWLLACWPSLSPFSEHRNSQEDDMFAGD